MVNLNIGPISSDEQPRHSMGQQRAIVYPQLQITVFSQTAGFVTAADRSSVGHPHKLSRFR